MAQESITFYVWGRYQFAIASSVFHNDATITKVECFNFPKLGESNWCNMCNRTFSRLVVYGKFYIFQTKSLSEIANKWDLRLDLKTCRPSEAKWYYMSNLSNLPVCCDLKLQINQKKTIKILICEISIRITYKSIPLTPKWKVVLIHSCC